MGISAMIPPRKVVNMLKFIDENEKALGYLPYSIEEFATQVIRLLSSTDEHQAERARLKDTRDTLFKIVTEKWEAKIKVDEFAKDDKNNNQPFYAHFYKKNKRGYKR